LQSYLGSGSAYRRAIRDDVQVFALQLPFYTNKPLYLLGGRLALSGGAAVARAPFVVSAVSYALIAVALCALAVALGSYVFGASVAVMLTMLSPPLRELADLASPDALDAARHGGTRRVALARLGCAALPLVAATTTRPDASILALGVLYACWSCEPTQRRTLTFGAVAVVVCAVAVLVPILTGSYGWVTLMRHTFINRCIEPADFQQGISRLDYPKAVIEGLRGRDSIKAAVSTARFSRADRYVTVGQLCVPGVYSSDSVSAPDRPETGVLGLHQVAIASRACVWRSAQRPRDL